jgi:hypothetical protein
MGFNLRIALQMIIEHLNDKGNAIYINRRRVWLYQGIFNLTLKPRGARLYSAGFMNAGKALVYQNL